MIEIPLGLRTAIESGGCTLFIGAGLGDHIRDQNGNAAPSANTLAKQLADKFKIEVKSEFDLSQIAQLIELRIGRDELITFLRSRLSGLQPDKMLQWLFSLRWSSVFTTNYDNAIEKAYEILPNPTQNPITISAASQFVDHDPRFEIPIYHIHGSLFGDVKHKILITEEDYARFRERRRMMFELLKTKFASSPVLYIGYSNLDPNWKVIISEIESEFYPKELPQSFRISPNIDPIYEEILESKNIKTIKSTYKEFYEAASTIIKSSEQDSSRYTSLKEKVPPDLIPHFEKNPAPVSRLLYSWDYITQENFHDKPNTYTFLRGNRPNWPLVGSREIFERDIEEEIYDDLIDFYTSPSNNPRISITLGPAGYGTTTLLMTLGARLVKDNIGQIYMLKLGMRLSEGDIDYAISISEKKPIFIIDSAADYTDVIHTIFTRLRNQNKSVYLLLGDRLNEWRQSQDKLHIQEYLINPLSDPEINRLLDFLAEKSELGILTDLSREMQFSAIKEKHKKELLVALREATEGKSFDAILEDEYRNISNEIAQKMYLIVCCFHQNGVLIRDNLLANIMGLSLTSLYENSEGSTEGVVVWEIINETEGNYAARSRHRIIAKVVWERCSLPGQRDEILKESLSSLNLNYGLDKNAFEEFVRSDHTVDQIQTLEGKIRFFEIAAKKDPDSPYVRQHYARMLLREEKYDLALAQIDHAIKLSPRTRVLYNTKGNILRYLALSSESPEIGRRRLAQSEECYHHCLSLYERDEYGYQGLAQLYREWAEKASSSDETAEYITKAEDIINEGLKIVNSRSSLWIESSKIQSFLGEEPSRIEALAIAVKESPGSIIARYILGRTYRIMKQYKSSVGVLEYVITHHHDEFRCFVEYALSLSALRKEYNEAIAILKLSTLYGLSDPRFIATLGGMLIMNGKITEGINIFNEALKQNFNSEEIHKIQFYPWNFSNLNDSLRIKGSIIVRKAGYALVEAEGYTPFLLPGFRINGVDMEKDTLISFEPAFCAKGSLALHPIPLE